MITLDDLCRMLRASPAEVEAKDALLARSEVRPVSDPAEATRRAAELERVAILVLLDAWHLRQGAKLVTGGAS